MMNGSAIVHPITWPALAVPVAVVNPDGTEPAAAA
jgi:hypothetical protein